MHVLERGGTGKVFPEGWRGSLFSGSFLAENEAPDVIHDRFFSELVEYLVTHVLVKDQGDIVAACLLEPLRDLRGTVSVSAYRVFAAGYQQQRHILGNKLVALIRADVAYHVEQICVAGSGKGEAASRVFYVFIYYSIVSGEPVVGGPARLDPLVVGTESRSRDQLAEMPAALEPPDDFNKELGYAENFVGTGSPHDDNAVHTGTVHGQPCPGDEGAHRVTQDEVRSVHVLDLHDPVELLYVLDHDLPAACLSEISPVFRFGAVAVADMIVAADQDSVLIEVLSQRRIAGDVLRHSVHQLEYGYWFSFRFPYVVVDSAFCVFAKECFFSHGLKPPVQPTLS